MNDKQFNQLVKHHFSEILQPIGFSHKKSLRSTFYRQTANGIYHIIVPSLRGGGTWFNLMIYATSPLIESDFELLFPDELGVPSDLFCFLDVKHGVGVEMTDFRCNKKEGFIRNFTTQAAPAIIKYAIPYLDRIQSLEDLIPHIHHDLYMGFALWHVGRKNEALKLLKKERDKLSKIEDAFDDSIKRQIIQIDELVKPKLVD